jgi:membrane protein
MPAAAWCCGYRTSTRRRALEQTQTARFEPSAIGVLAMAAIWRVLNQAVNSFLAHEALSRGAAIAFYVVTSLAPVLLIVVAIAGVVFGPDAVRGSLVKELSGVFGQQGGELIQTMLARSSDKSIFGALMVIVTASGVFREMQTGLNRAWDVKPTDQPWLSLVRTRAASLGLVAALGFLLMVSLAASTGLAALGNYLGARSAFAPLLLSILNTVVSIALFTVLFAAIFKVLPDTAIAWRDVIIGAFVTAVLFTIGKSLIGWYLGTTAASSGYGAAGALILILLWSYYSAQILLFGAELTRAMAPPQPDDKQGKTSESEASSPSLQPDSTDTWQPHRFKRNI